MDITNKETVRNISTLTQQLSEKEQQILEMNAKGLTNKQIGGQLGISASRRTAGGGICLSEK